MTVHGLLVPFHRADGQRLHVRLVVDGESFDLVSDGDRLSTRRREDEIPDLLVTTTAAELVAARRGEQELSAVAMRGPPTTRPASAGSSPSMARGGRREMAEAEAAVAPSLTGRGSADRDVRLRLRRPTVARALIDLLPAEDLVYIGDTGRYPYGPKPLGDVRPYARQLAWSLVKDHDVKAVIVACNTAAAAGLDDLRGELPVPVLDVIDPGRRSAGRGHPLRPDRCHRHGRHDRLGGLPPRRRRRGRRAGRGRPESAACPGFRRVRRARA